MGRHHTNINTSGNSLHMQQGENNPNCRSLGRRGGSSNEEDEDISTYRDQAQADVLLGGGKDGHIG